MCSRTRRSDCTSIGRHAEQVHRNEASGSKKTDERRRHMILWPASLLVRSYHLLLSPLHLLPVAARFLFLLPVPVCRLPLSPYLACTSFAEDTTDAVGYRWFLGHVEHTHDCPVCPPIVGALWLPAAWKDGATGADGREGGDCWQAVGEAGADKGVSKRVQRVSSDQSIHASRLLVCHLPLLPPPWLCACAVRGFRAMASPTSKRQTDRKGGGQHKRHRMRATPVALCSSPPSSPAVCASHVCWQLAPRGWLGSALLCSASRAGLDALRTHGSTRGSRCHHDRGRMKSNKSVPHVLSFARPRLGFGRCCSSSRLALSALSAATRSSLVSLNCI
jgi:hypothetical protein